MPSEAEARLGLAPGFFPFKSHFLKLDAAEVHYVDEGAGPPLLMLHGNPTWSFQYARIIRDLRVDHRCIAIDFPGFGLSRAAPDFSFRPAAHADVVAELLRRLDIQDATLIAQDWGVPIGLSAMTQTSGRITRLCLGNGWAWPVNGDFHFEWFSRLMGGFLGAWAARRFAAFVNLVMPVAMRRQQLADDVFEAYRAPFNNGANRMAMAIFAREILKSGDWLAGVERGIKSFDGPAHFIWPANDIAFRDKELARWRAIFPHAGVTRIENCGHFFWEDAPQDALIALRRFLHSG
jgi:haloalkane dehalogenase